MSKGIVHGQNILEKNQRDNEVFTNTDQVEDITDR